MPNSSAQIVKKLWNYCNVLRDDGLSYGDYVEQLTYLLFLKMAHERTQPPFNQPSRIPDGFDWPSLTEKDGPEGRVAGEARREAKLDQDAERRFGEGQGAPSLSEGAALWAR